MIFHHALSFKWQTCMATSWCKEILAMLYCCTVWKSFICTWTEHLRYTCTVYVHVLYMHICLLSTKHGRFHRQLFVQNKLSQVSEIVYLLVQYRALQVSETSICTEQNIIVIYLNVQYHAPQISQTSVCKVKHLAGPTICLYNTIQCTCTSWVSKDIHAAVQYNSLQVVSEMPI